MNNKDTINMIATDCKLYETVFTYVKKPRNLIDLFEKYDYYLTGKYPTFVTIFKPITKT